jgi:hypothetical protein
MPVRTARDDGFAVPAPVAAKPELAAPATTRLAVIAKSSKTPGSADEREFRVRILMRWPVCH